MSKEELIIQKCKKCGWEGTKYEVNVGLNYYFCPQCEETIKLIEFEKISIDRMFELMKEHFLKGISNTENNEPNRKSS